MPLLFQSVPQILVQLYGSVGRTLIPLILAALLAGVGVAPSAGVAAPVDSPPEQADQMAEPDVSLDVSDIPSEKVSQFVTAYLQVVELVERREGELQQAETDSESLQIQRDIQSEAFALITDAGLTRQEYWQLLGLANSDPDFRERILAQLEEATQ
ncbi:DUF4168 domain-containing protein [Halomicronema hongdechloris]|nr:DUF4168 domain-containing protein [Halomicronema hongdechloris]